MAEAQFTAMPHDVLEHVELYREVSCNPLTALTARSEAGRSSTDKIRQATSFLLRNRCGMDRAVLMRLLFGVMPAPEPAVLAAGVELGFLLTFSMA